MDGRDGREEMVTQEGELGKGEGGVGKEEGIGMEKRMVRRRGVGRAGGGGSGEKITMGRVLGNE